MNSVSNYDPIWGAVVIRRAVAGDQPVLHALAEVDSARPLTDIVLIGELRGEAVAALDLSDGTVIADPFVPTAAVVELLRLRARQVGPDLAPDQGLRHGRPLPGWRQVLNRPRAAVRRLLHPGLVASRAARRRSQITVR